MLQSWMRKCVGEGMGCENSKYEALFTILPTTDKKQRGPTPFAVCDSRQGGTGPELMQTHQLFTPIVPNGKSIMATISPGATYLPPRRSP